jgi:hypothetical protein
MHTNLFSSSYANAIENYLKITENLIIIIVNEQLKITEYNKALPRIIKNQANLTGENILDFLIFESRDSNPFRDPPPKQPQRLIFRSSNKSSFSLDCVVYRVEKNYLVIGTHLMLANDEIIDKMTLLSNELINMTRELHQKNIALEEAQDHIKALGGLIPICMYCKEIRDDKGYWNNLEQYITDNSEAEFSHSICPKCMKIRYPDD